MQLFLLVVVQQFEISKKQRKPVAARQSRGLGGLCESTDKQCCVWFIGSVRTNLLVAFLKLGIFVVFQLSKLDPAWTAELCIRLLCAARTVFGEPETDWDC